MALITDVPEPNLWTEICKEYESRRPPFKIPEKKELMPVNYDSSKYTPVFYGKIHMKTRSPDVEPSGDFDPAVSHPACVGYSFLDNGFQPLTPKPSTPELDKHKCSPGVYLEKFVFPTLLPALEAMLMAAKKEKCFEKRRTKFNALDFLTEYLYKNNPIKPGDERTGITLFDIPFVQRFLKNNPRPPLPLSLIWTEEEACLVIQSHWRGYLVRRQPEIQELRVWQKEWREENNRGKLLEDFWYKAHQHSKNSASN